MDRKAFVSGRESYTRRNRYYYLAMWLFWIGCFVATRFLPKGSYEIAAVVFFLLCGIGLAGLAWRDRWYVKHIGLSCASCGRSLLGRIEGALAVTTGKCSRCGGAAFDGKL